MAIDCPGTTPNQSPFKSVPSSVFGGFRLSFAVCVEKMV